MANPAAILQQVTQHMSTGRFEQARQLLMRSLGSRPAPELLNAMVAVLVNLKQLDQAAYFAQRANEALPNNPAILTNYANVLAMQGKFDLAIPIYQQVISLAPANTDARLGIANCLSQTRRWDEAIVHLAAARQTIPAGPARDPIDARYLSSLHSAGRVEDAISAIREQITRAPDDLFLRGALAQTLNYSDRATPAEIAQAHLDYSQTLARTLPPASPRTYANPVDPNRRLRVAFLSPDLKQHPCANFVEPLFKHLPRDQFEVIAYFTSFPDTNTARLKPMVDLWRDVPNLSDADLANTIANDRIDILIELSGLTLGHRLPALHSKPAPLQLTYLGYPNITGAPFIDARIVDAITDPPAASHVGEQLIRIDSPFLCFTLWSDAPPPAATRPAQSPVFGSFNAISKLTDSTLDAWAKILHQVPDSTLLLKAPQLVDTGTREFLLHRLAARQIPRERIEIHASILPYADHLNLYSRIDVALDPFPYQGTTTTCEALAMGVPVISLEGQTHAQRVGSSLLTAVGAPELITRTTADYIAAAVALMRDQRRRDHYRQTLPASVRTGPLGDGPAFSRRFGDALRDLWRMRCRNP